MPVQSMQAVAEHQLFKAAMPLVAAALIGSVTWLFVTVIDIDKKIHVLEDQMVDMEKDVLAGYIKLEKLKDTLTEVRIDQSGMKSKMKNTSGDPRLETDPFHLKR